MIKTKTILAMLVATAGLAAAAQVQAGQGTVMLGSTGFADRCAATGGTLSDTEGGLACALPSTLLECSFAGAHADCEWNGVQNKLEVVRVIGMLGAESLASGNGSDDGDDDDIVVVVPIFIN